MIRPIQRLIHQFRLITVAGILMAGVATAQVQHGPRYFPLSQHSPPGKAAAWMSAIRPDDPYWMQPLQIEVPGGGQVELYSGAPQPSAVADSPALIAVNPGHVYRLRVSGMSGLPGVEIYPTIELLDRLHPPAGRENEFPIPIILTPGDIQTAQRGQLVTRVIYLEQPQLAQIIDPLRREIPQTVLPSENALTEADRLGRPMAIIRIGSRRPSAGSAASFYGTGGHVEMRSTQPEQSGGATARMNSPETIRRISARRER